MSQPPSIRSRVERAAIRWVKTGNAFSTMQILLAVNGDKKQEPVNIQQVQHVLQDFRQLKWIDNAGAIGVWKWVR